MPVGGNLDVIIDRIHRLKQYKGGDDGTSIGRAASADEEKRRRLQRLFNRPVLAVPKGKSLSRCDGAVVHRSSRSTPKRGVQSYRNGNSVDRLLSSDSECASTTGTDPQLSHLESLECFAAHFRRKRIMLGYTQQQVGDTLGRRYNAYFSQTTISRFEDLNLSVRNMSKLRPLIQRWIVDTEKAMEDGMSAVDLEAEKEENGSTFGAGSDCSFGRRRRKRTTIDDRMRSFLEQVFQRTPRPSTSEIEQLASELSLRTEVVRVWFCNRRQREARSSNSMFIGAVKAEPNSDEFSRRNGPPMLEPYFVGGGDGGGGGSSSSSSGDQEQQQQSSACGETSADEHSYAMKLKSDCCA